MLILFVVNVVLLIVQETVTLATGRHVHQGVITHFFLLCQHFRVAFLVGLGLLSVKTVVWHSVWRALQLMQMLCF